MQRILVFVTAVLFPTDMEHYVTSDNHQLMYHVLKVVYLYYGLYFIMHYIYIYIYIYH